MEERGELTNTMTSRIRHCYQRVFEEAERKQWKTVVSGLGAWRAQMEGNGTRERDAGDARSVH